MLNATGAYTPAGWLNSHSINTASTGVLALTANDAETLDFSQNGGYAGLFLGSLGGNTFSGWSCPAPAGYNLGGARALTVTTCPDRHADDLTAFNGGTGGTLTLTGSNTYSGGNVDQHGHPPGEGSARDAGSGGLTINSGTLQTIGNNFSFANASPGLSGSVHQNSNARHAASTLTVGSDNSSTSFNGSVINGGAGTLGLTKVGSGSLFLGGGANITYTGSTNITGGTQLICSPYATAYSSPTTIGNGAPDVLEMARRHRAMNQQRWRRGPSRSSMQRQPSKTANPSGTGRHQPSPAPSPPPA